jgi:protein TonB
VLEKVERPLRKKSAGAKAVSLALHILVVTSVVVIPLLKVTDTLPEVPTMMAFVVAEAAAPPPPPPPPPPAAARSAEARPAPRPTPTTGAFAAPIEPPADIRPEAAVEAADAGGVVGGVEGGVPGGVLGGIVGGIVAAVPPPPPPPPPPPAPVPRGPVRIGGQLTAPALLRRVEPIYPEVAASAHLFGMVILEAVVGQDGCVDSVKVLRSRHPFLDTAAIDALKQWQYSPLVLNGVPTAFVLTVTFNFGTK